MKRLLKKNQIIITTLAIMIAIAGYLNYSGRIFGKEDTKETSGTLANQELLDIGSGSIRRRGGRNTGRSGTYKRRCGRGEGDKGAGAGKE